MAFCVWPRLLRSDSGGADVGEDQDFYCNHTFYEENEWRAGGVIMNGSQSSDADKSSMNPLLLILDLDETLIHATGTRLDRPEDFRVYDYFVYKRPHVDSFLHEVLGRYRVAIWTSSGREYAEAVVANLLADTTRLEFFWCSERTTLRYDGDVMQHVQLKKMEKVKRRGYDLDRVLVLDDSPEKHVKNYGNLVRIRPYEGVDPDDELLRVLSFLQRIENRPNLRAIEKRWWREDVGRLEPG